MILWILLAFLATVLSCQPPIPQAAFSQSYQSSSPEVSYSEQSTPQAEYSQSESPFPGYQQPPPLGNDLVPFTRALSAPLAEVGLTKAPLENIPPPVDLEALRMAGRCAEIKSLTEFEDCVQVSLLPRQSPTAWQCSFEEGTACKFQAITSGFSVGRLPATSYSSFAQMSSRYDFDSPQGQFLYIISAQGLRAYEELIISARIPCQQGDGELRLSYWLSPPEGTIRVCTLDDEMRSCTQPFVHTNQSGVIVAVINPIKPKSQTTSFEVEIVASNLIRPSIFAIDNIEYKADFCEPKIIPIQNKDQDQFFEAEDTLDSPTSEIRRTQAHIPKRPDYQGIEADSHVLDEKMDEAMGDEIESMSDEIMENEEEKTEKIAHRKFHPQLKVGSAVRLPVSVSEKKNPCNVLRCHFEENLCGWHNRGEEANYGKWRYRGYKKIAKESKEFEDLEDDAGIAIAGSDSTPSPLYRKIAFLLESPEILALTNLTMLYDVKRQNDDLTLQVCFDTPTYCPYKLPPYRKEIGWQIDQIVTVPENTRRIYFLAMQWKRYSRLLIDNIRVIGC
ncbi:unnamed protein product, partial [Mesorhabditis belari]|uniref:MAM domain-containing protein n=1 Tax=Mesorhabditis belari TaxID=2138241 RepID=A0AAF3FPU1_9BILA